jgi:solute carrier family 25 folate transporter 32
MFEKKSVKEGVAGFTAGAVSSILLHPFDLAKTRYQVNESANSIVSVAKLISTNGLRSLYRGFIPNLVGQTSAWGLYFACYSLAKEQMGKSYETLNALHHLSASAAASAVTVLFTNPIFLVKTRMFTQRASDSNAYSGLYDGLRKCSKNGLSGLYVGLGPSLFGVSHGALQFMAYEELKQLNYQSSTLVKIGFAVVSKLFATVTIYPYQVVKSRMQVQKEYVSGNYDSVSLTIRNIYM